MHTHNHNEEHFTASDRLRDSVIGLSDGLTVPFALAAGLSGVVNSNHIIIIGGIAEIVAGSIAMGLGGYLAGKTDVNHYHSELKREYDEIERLPEKEKQEVRDVFASYGLSEKAQNEITDAISQDPDKWVDFMMKFELGLEKPEPGRALKSALTIASAYIIGGFIPLSGYFFTTQPIDGLRISTMITLICLFLFGYLKSKLVGQSPIKGAFSVMLIGAIASLSAFLIAKAVSH